VKLGAFPPLSAIGTPPAKIFANRRRKLRCSEKQEGTIMKTLFAQTATFALSAVGALAILVGVIDHPQVVYDVAAATPAVSLVA
jgi:hypothetical protein